MAVRTKTTKSGLVYYVETRGHWERVGSDKREANRLNERRKKECKAGTFRPAVSGAITVGRYLETWLDKRTNRASTGDRRMLELHVLTRAWFVALKMEDVTNPLTQRLADELKAGPPALRPKYVYNIFGAVRTAFRAALRAGIINREVCLLEPGTLSKKSREREPYTLLEARSLVASAVGDRLVWLALAFYTGMRCGEVSGRRWRDWDREAKPLGALTVATQYDDQPLKGDDESTDRPRRAPVHEDLAAILQWWWDVGFEITYLRKPTPDDLIIERVGRAGECLTRSMTYKALERDCAKAAVKRRGQHATRHMFLTQARRASPLAKDLAEKITHNAEGEMVDQYTHWEWDPLCEVISRFPSLMPAPTDSEPAHGSAAAISNRRKTSLFENSTESVVSPELPSVSQKHQVRVLELEPTHCGSKNFCRWINRGWVSEVGTGRPPGREPRQGEPRFGVRRRGLVVSRPCTRASATGSSSASRQCANTSLPRATRRRLHMRPRPQPRTSARKERLGPNERCLSPAASTRAREMPSRRAISARD